MIARDTSVLLLPPSGPLMRLHPRLIEVERYLRRNVPERLADGAWVWDLGAPGADRSRAVDEIAADLEQSGVTSVRVPAGARGAALGARFAACGFAVAVDAVAALWTIEHWLARIAESVPDGTAVVAAPGAPASARDRTGPAVALLPLRVGPRLSASIAGGLELARALADRPRVQSAPIPFFLEAADEEPTSGGWWGITPAAGHRTDAIRDGMRSLIGRLHPERLQRYLSLERAAHADEDPWA